MSSATLHQCCRASGSAAAPSSDRSPRCRPAPHVAAGRTAARRRARRRTSPTAHAVVEQAFADVAAGLREQSGRSTGTVKDVLRGHRADGRRPGAAHAGARPASTRASRWSARSTASSRCSRRCSSRPAATSRSGSPTCGPSATAWSPPRWACRQPGVPVAGPAVRDRRQGPRARRHGRARPGQRARRSSPSSAAPPATPRSSPGSSASRASCGSPVRRRSRTARTSPSTPPTAPSRSTRPRASAPSWSGGATVERTLESDTAAGATADGRAVALLANIGTAEDAARVAGGGVEGVGLFRTEVLFLESTDGADAGGPGRRLRARAALVRRPQGRRPHARRGRGQAAGVRDAARRGEPGARRARLPPGAHASRAPGHPARGPRARAGRDGDHALGHGADDRDRRRGARRSPRRARAAGVAHGRRDDRGAGRGPAGAGDPRRGGLRLPGHQRPRAVHDGRPTACAASWPTCSTRGSRPSWTWSTRPPGGARRRASPSGSAGSPRPTRCSRWCSSGSA